MKFIIIIMTSMFLGNIWAQEQVAIRLNESGLLKVLNLAVNYSTDMSGRKSVVVPKGILKLNVPKDKIQFNPIIKIVDRLTNLDLHHDINFYLGTGDGIIVDGRIDRESLSTQIISSDEKGFEVKLKVNLAELSVKAKSLSLCENRLKKSPECGDGLKVKFSNVKIDLKGTTTLEAVLRFETEGQYAHMSVLSVKTNIDVKNKNAPKLDIGFSKIVIPEINIVSVDNEMIRVNVSNDELKNKILEHKDFLARKLLGFVADFMASDLAEMVNLYLINKKVLTSLHLLDEKILAGQMNIPKLYKEQLFERAPINDTKSELMNIISSVIRFAQVDLSLAKIKTPGNKDLELNGAMDFVLNGRKLNIDNKLANSDKELPVLDLSEHRENDLTLAISEPLINGALDLVNSTGLFQDVFKLLAKNPGVSVESVKMHFTSNKSFVLVANLVINLDQTASPDVGAWMKKKIGGFLERNNNNGVIFFPLEIEVYPNFNENRKGQTEIYLEVLSPFSQAGLVNRFGYPSNLNESSDVVKSTIIDKLKDGILPFTDRFYNIDVHQLLNKSGVEFKAKSISIIQSSYLLINLDIDKLDPDYNKIMSELRRRQ